MLTLTTSHCLVIGEEIARHYPDGTVPTEDCIVRAEMSLRMKSPKMLAVLEEREMSCANKKLIFSAYVVGGQPGYTQRNFKSPRFSPSERSKRRDKTCILRANRVIDRCSGFELLLFNPDRPMTRRRRCRP